MVRRKAATARGVRIDTLEISKGQLGPVPPCTLQIRPLTVFVGRQGTGKSLVAQVLYALDELPFLAQYVQSQQRNRLSAPKLFARVVDQLRSAERRFAGFASKQTHIDWTRGTPWTVPTASRTFSFTMYKAARLTRPTATSARVVGALAHRGVRPTRHAVFVPTERMMVSQLRSAISDRVLSLPITYELFANWLDLAAGVQDDIEEAGAKAILALSEQALAGRARRLGDQWKWDFVSGRGKNRTRGTLDLDMASSGQRANWSLAYLAHALFELRNRRDFAQELTIFVEEPELHLHPAAEVAMSRILAVLVRSGFRVVVTTHSLNILYSFNNLMLADKKLGATKVKNAPDPSMRLHADEVSVYAFTGGVPRDLVDRKESFIDEHELGDIGAELGAEMNFLLNHEPVP